MIQELYQDRKAVIEWLSKAPASYSGWLGSMYEQELKTMKTTDSIIELNRAQGRLAVLERLIGLEDELRKEVK